MFPGYLFVLLDLSVDPWHYIRRTRGVRTMLFGETPTPLPHDEAQRLLAAFADGPVDKAHAIQIGMRAVVEEGAFMGNEGMCTDSDSDSAQLMLHILGRMMPLNFPHEVLREA